MERRGQDDHSRRAGGRPKTLPAAQERTEDRETSRVAGELCADDWKMQLQVKYIHEHPGHHRFQHC